jgi:hypothetical protein
MSCYRYVAPLGATDMSPLRGFEDAGAPMLCYQYVAPLGLFRPVWADRIVAQRANILVASPRPRKHDGPVGAEDRVNKPLHQCGLPICRPSGALKTLARRCLATNMSPRWGFEDAGAAMFCYRYVAPLGLFRPVWAERIVAQRANILVASPDQENTLAL